MPTHRRVIAKACREVPYAVQKRRDVGASARAPTRPTFAFFYRRELFIRFKCSFVCNAQKSSNVRCRTAPVDDTAVCQLYVVRHLGGQPLGGAISSWR
ncbi:hypothetical protein EVAR_48960_1 [Eumeta japonica]|uniref:Uncharacterized protein n=1 Tax=Eumeta variegata TaxID=151549 RepID=A0A4C1Y800_EUMVA|nr:hypothetical protein EVAR_48960_1 [Eumeta japonica]